MLILQTNVLTKKATDLLVLSQAQHLNTLGFLPSSSGLFPKRSMGSFALSIIYPHPKGFSVNAGVSPEDSTVYYARIDDVVRVVTLPKQILKVHFGLSLSDQHITISWACGGVELSL
jgi:hypothetical protein